MPSGTPGNLTVLDWAGFKAAVSYTFDDTNSSQIEHYAELQALGVRMTFYLITGKTTEFDEPGLGAGAAGRPRARQPHRQPRAGRHRRRRRRGRRATSAEVRHHRLDDGGALRRRQLPAARDRRAT